MTQWGSQDCRPIGARLGSARPRFEELKFDLFDRAFCVPQPPRSDFADTPNFMNYVDHLLKKLEVPKDMDKNFLMSLKRTPTF